MLREHRYVSKYLNRSTVYLKHKKSYSHEPDSSKLTYKMFNHELQI